MAVPNGQAGETGDVRPADGGLSTAEPKPATKPPAAPKVELAPKVTSRSATSEELTQIATRIWATVDESSSPISAGLLASRLRQEHADIMENWNGCGTFKAFYRSLRLARLIWVSGSGGRILDPGRHDVEGALQDPDPESPWAGLEGTFAVVKDVCALTGAPMLSPRDLKLVISTLAKVLERHDFQLASIAQLVCRQCFESDGLRVRQRDVTFLMRGMQLNGHVFGQGKDDESTLASRLVNQILFLCEREQKVLDQSEIGHIRNWILGPALD